MHTDPPVIISQGNLTTRLIRNDRDKTPKPDALARVLLAEEAYYAFFRRLFLKTSRDYLRD